MIGFPITSVRNPQTQQANNAGVTRGDGWSGEGGECKRKIPPLKVSISGWGRADPTLSSKVPSLSWTKS